MLVFLHKVLFFSSQHHFLIYAVIIFFFFFSKALSKCSNKAQTHSGGKESNKTKKKKRRDGRWMVTSTSNLLCLTGAPTEKEPSFELLPSDAILLRKTQAFCCRRKGSKSTPELSLTEEWQSRKTTTKHVSFSSCKCVCVLADE